MIEIIPNWHPLLVHFTLALFSVSIVLFAASMVLKGSKISEYLLITAKFNLWIGASFSVLTGLAGFDAYNTVDHDTPSHTAMTDHRNWAIFTLLVFAVLTIWSLFLRGLKSNVNIVFLLVGIIGLSALMTTGYKGAEVVYRYGLGVMSLPKAEGDGHTHDHGSHSHESKPKDPTVLKDIEMSEDIPMNNNKHHKSHDDGHDYEH